MLQWCFCVTASLISPQSLVCCHQLGVIPEPQTGLAGTPNPSEPPLPWGHLQGVPAQCPAWLWVTAGIQSCSEPPVPALPTLQKDPPARSLPCSHPREPQLQVTHMFRVPNRQNVQALHPQSPGESPGAASPSPSCALGWGRVHQAEKQQQFHWGSV